jgi:hypothetical protein
VVVRWRVLLVVAGALTLGCGSASTKPGASDGRASGPTGAGGSRGMINLDDAGTRGSAGASGAAGAGGMGGADALDAAAGTDASVGADDASVSADADDGTAGSNGAAGAGDAGAPDSPTVGADAAVDEAPPPPPACVLGTAAIGSCVL